MPETLTHPAKLLVKLHGKGSRHIELIQEVFTIGRKVDNTLAIEDPSVSGHHARIAKVQAVFFIEGLKSTNGTSVNGQPITRHQLHDADMITIGRHRLIFQENVTAGTTALPHLSNWIEPWCLEKRTAPHTNSQSPPRSWLFAGKTDKLEYPLTKQVNTIGSQEGAIIRLTGWFAPKSAATIAQRGQSYSISPSQGAKPLFVNDTEIVGQQDLKDGDLIEVAGVKLSFYLLSETKNTSGNAHTTT